MSYVATGVPPAFVESDTVYCKSTGVIQSIDNVYQLPNGQYMYELCDSHKGYFEEDLVKLHTLEE